MVVRVIDEDKRKGRVIHIGAILRIYYKIINLIQINHAYLKYL